MRKPQIANVTITLRVILDDNTGHHFTRSLGCPTPNEIADADRLAEMEDSRGQHFAKCRIERLFRWVVMRFWTRLSPDLLLQDLMNEVASTLPGDEPAPMPSSDSKVDF
jgi:hypothetical protein